MIAGSRKGHRIAAPKGVTTRPTGDRVREAAFNLIGPVDDAAVLDLFAGSGAMGIEALSRGAASAVFVESDRDAARTINANLDKLRLTGARVLQQDVSRFLAAEHRRYDLILIDPPYELVESLAVPLSQHLPRLLADDGLLVLETPGKHRAGARAARATSRSVRLRAAYPLRAPRRVITAICPGSYDPVTNGHVDVIDRACSIFDRVVVGVVGNPHHKQPLFTLEERVEFLKDALRGLDNVEVDVFAELVVEFARRWDAKAIVKGLRVISDFEWEFQMNQLNRHLAPDIETVYVMAQPAVQLRLLQRREGDRRLRRNRGRLVPDCVAVRLREMFPNGRGGAPLSPQE